MTDVVEAGAVDAEIPESIDTPSQEEYDLKFVQDLVEGKAMLESNLAYETIKDLSKSAFVNRQILGDEPEAAEHVNQALELLQTSYTRRVDSVVEETNNIILRHPGAVTYESRPVIGVRAEYDKDGKAQFLAVTE